MSDLIIRSELIKELNKYCGNQRYLVSENIREIINNQPTSYDIDNVVEKLEERTDFLKDCTKYGNKNAKQQDKSYSAMMMYEVADLVDDLIEIVKQVSVADDVCEWKYNDSEYYWESSCEHLHIFMSDGPKENEYYFCPYCGKKIKVVNYDN